jgi:SpoVK/Ycf46/Vps4 family AAA+-type ATPase
MFDNITQAKNKASLYIRSGVQAIHVIAGGQQAQVQQMLLDISEELKYEMVCWNAADGFFSPSGRKMPFKVNPNILNFPKALERITSTNGGDYDPEYEKTNKYTTAAKDMPMLIAMYDAHYELGGIPAAVAKLKFMITNKHLANNKRNRILFIVTTNKNMNSDVVPYMKLLEMPLPSREELGEVFESVNNSLPEDQRCKDAELKYTILNALSGMTTHDAEDVLAEAIVKHKKINADITETIEEEKAVTLKKSEALTYTQKSKIPTEDQIGGYEELKKWVNERKVAYTSEAEKLNMESPKGLVLIGVPGTGKSKCAAAIARELAVPLVRLDVGAIFNSLVGESEKRVREVISTADALNGCVLLIDEADKVLGNAGESTGDSGVTRRIFGQILTWLADKKTKTFVVMTMNRIKGMPPELLRKGRFDELFFVDAPDAKERESIFKIHMDLRKLDYSKFTKAEWKKLVDHSEDFVGAEIEEAIKAARFTAYARDKKSKGAFDCETLLTSISQINPVVRLDAENIQAIREFGATKARNVNGRKVTLPSPVTQGSRGMSFSDPNVKG